MTNKPKRKLNIADIIRATKDMDATEHLQFIKLSGSQRLEAVREILDNLEEEK